MRSVPGRTGRRRGFISMRPGLDSLPKPALSVGKAGLQWSRAMGSQMEAESYDYIVTGAGSAGAVVAARLSESGRHRVLLLEAGGRDSNPWIHIPLGFARTYINPAVNWKFESAPQPQLAN